MCFADLLKCVSYKVGENKENKAEKERSTVKKVKVNMECVSSSDFRRYPPCKTYMPNNYFWLLTGGS